MAKAERLYRLALEKAGSGAGPTGGEQIGFRLAILYCREEKLDEAAALLRQELTRYPRSGELYAAMSLLHRLRFQNEEAEADMKLACQYGADPLLIEWISNNARK